MALPRALVERLIAAGERTAAVLDRSRPRVPPQPGLLAEAWRRGERRAPDLAPCAPLSAPALRRALEGAWGALGPSGWSAHYRARLAEVAGEVELAEALGDARCRELARRVFDEGDARFASRAREIAESWLRGPEGSNEPLVAVDDPHHEQSLISVLWRAIGQRGLAVRVEVVDGLAGVAEAGEGVVRVARGARLGGTAARRVAVHELEGHLAPRENGRRQGGLHHHGACGSGRLEEGRALWLEGQYGLFDDVRRRELAVRHRAALAVRAGAGYQEVVAQLSADGAPLEEAIGVACRALRGGGLARELWYLPAMLEVEETHWREPCLVDGLGTGRVGFELLRALPDLGELPAVLE